MRRKGNAGLKLRREWKRSLKHSRFTSNSPREVARRKRQIDQGQLKPNN